ncbi:hypothetical protein OTU49_013673, partial [Cherax quadricarinatus]
ENGKQQTENGNKEREREVTVTENGTRGTKREQRQKTGINKGRKQEVPKIENGKERDRKREQTRTENGKNKDNKRKEREHERKREILKTGKKTGRPTGKKMGNNAILKENDPKENGKANWKENGKRKENGKLYNSKRCAVLLCVGIWCNGPLIRCDSKTERPSGLRCDITGKHYRCDSSTAINRTNRNSK